MSNLFVDTAGWANLFVPTESYHAQTLEYVLKARQNRQILVTTNYIIAELVALIGSHYRSPRDRVFQYIDSVRENPSIQIVHIDLSADARAWRLCKSRPDKAWSLVDASSFVVMKKMAIQQALTTDRHFEQAGFIRLLK